MSVWPLYLAAKLAFVLFGMPVAFIDPVRRWSLPARAGSAFGAGALALTLHGLLLSMVGVRWTIASLALPLFAISVTAVAILLRRERVTPPAAPIRPLWLAWIIAGAGWLHYALSVISLRSTSADYVYFWGPKAVRFAAAGGIDAQLLADGYMTHLRPTYPPLVTIGYAWDILVSGGMKWHVQMLDSVIWLVAAAVVLHALLAETLERHATTVVAFWSVAICASAAFSYTAGNAEAPLIYFATLSGVALFRSDRGSTIFGAVMLSGCVLTKSEGRVLWIAITGGALLAQLVRRERIDLRRVAVVIAAPALAVGAWYAYLMQHGLPTHDEMRQGLLDQVDPSQAGAVAVTMLRHLDAGSHGAAWLVPAAILIVCWRRGWRNAIAPAAASFALMAVYFVNYLAEKRPLEMVMLWEVPRISQPSLSLWIVAAALAYGYAVRPETRTGSELASPPASSLRE